MGKLGLGMVRRSKKKRSPRLDLLTQCRVVLTPTSEHPVAGGIACAAWLKAGKNAIAVLSVNTNNELICNAYDADSGKWQPAVVITKTISFSAVACSLLNDDDGRLKAFVQLSGKSITEFDSGFGGTSFVPNTIDVPVIQ